VGGPGPSLFAYDKRTDGVRSLGPLFPPSSIYSYATGEGWYFIGAQPTKLYVYLVGDSALWRYDVLAHQFDPSPAMDLSACRRPRVCPSNAYILQPHSSDDDLTHSATVQDLAFNRLGCVVYRSARKRFHFFAPPEGFALDECHVDKSGRWLMLLEVTASGFVQNRIDHDDRRFERVARPPRHGVGIRRGRRQLQRPAQCDDPAEVPG
jgi:hypothetical protein